MQHKPITSKCQMRLVSEAFSSPIKQLHRAPQLIPRGDCHLGVGISGVAECVLKTCEFVHPSCPTLTAVVESCFRGDSGVCFCDPTAQ